MKKPRQLRDLNRLTPKMVRFLARKQRGKAPMSHAEIAERAGLAPSTVAKISRCEVWDGMTFRVMEAFSRACGVNLLCPWRQVRFWRRNKLSYLERGTHNQRKMFARLLADIHSNAAS